MKLLMTAALAVTLFGSQSIEAQQRICASRDSVIARLAEKFGETQQSVALTANGKMIETYASLESGGWTIFVTTADGTSCLLASGQAFELSDGAPAPSGDPT